MYFTVQGKILTLRCQSFLVLFENAAWQRERIFWKNVSARVEQSTKDFNHNTGKVSFVDLSPKL